MFTLILTFAIGAFVGWVANSIYMEAKAIKALEEHMGHFDLEIWPEALESEPAPKKKTTKKSTKKKATKKK